MKKITKTTLNKLRKYDLENIMLCDYMLKARKYENKKESNFFGKLYHAKYRENTKAIDTLLNSLDKITIDKIELTDAELIEFTELYTKHDIWLKTFDFDGFLNVLDKFTVDRVIPYNSEYKRVLHRFSRYTVQPKPKPTKKRK